MKHRYRHEYRTRYGYEYVDTYNIQNIKRSTGVMSVLDTDSDAC